MTQKFAALVRNAPGIVARIEAVFRRQNVPLRSFGFTAGSDESRRCRVICVADASAEQAAFVARLLRRIVDVEVLLEPAPGIWPAARSTGRRSTVARAHGKGA